MDKTVLQSLLDVQIFTLPDNDDRLTQLETSATQLAEKLQENIANISSYTLVALDPKISGIEPVIIEVENIIKGNWTTLRSNRPEPPVSIIRSVILSALNKIGVKDADCAQIIYHTASNYYPYAVLGNEKEIVSEILLNIGEVAEQSATKEWALKETEPSIKLPSLKASPIKFNNVEIKTDTIETAFGIIAINNQYNGCAGTVSVNNAFNELKTKVPSAVTNAISGAFTTFLSGFDSKDFETSVNKFFTDFKKSLDENLKSCFIAMQAVERRSRLLWWKEAMYSQYLKKSYREIDRDLRPVVMAYDLLIQLPNIIPASVDNLLKDTLYQLNDKLDEAIKFSDILTAIENSPNKALLNGCFHGEKIENKDRRMTITDFIYLLVEGDIKTKNLLKCTGIDPKKTVTPCELSVMVLHDLLSNRIIRS